MGKLHSFRKCRVFAGISFGLELLKTPPGERGIPESPSGVLLDATGQSGARPHCLLGLRPAPPAAGLPPRGAQSPGVAAACSLSCCHLPSFIEFSMCRAALHVTSQVLAPSFNRQGSTECQREVWAAEPGPWNWKDLAPVLVLSCSGSSASPQARWATSPALQALVSAWVRDSSFPHGPSLLPPFFPFSTSVSQRGHSGGG